MTCRVGKGALSRAVPTALRPWWARFALPTLRLPQRWQLGGLRNAASDRRGGEMLEVATPGQQLGKPLAGVKHPRFDRILRHSDNLGDLFDCLVVVVNKVDDLAVIRRELCQARAALSAAIHLQDGLFRG